MEALHQRLASILEASPDFVGTMDSEGNPTYINPAGRALLGLAPADPMDSWSVAKQYTPEAKEQRDRVALPTALDRGVWSGESAFLPLNGESIPVAQVLIAHKDGDGNLQYLSSVARDLRPWKEAQAVLQERERFLATLVANLPGVAYRRRKAPGWPMEYISEGCLELTGYSAEALMAARPYFNDIVHAEDRGRVYREVDAALAEGRYFKVEYRICRADGSELWVWSKGRGIYDESGQLIAREGFIGDINDRVRAQLQLERLNAELEARVEERTAKLAEANQHLEAFAYSVSHDLKAPLRGIHGYSRLLLEDYRDLLPDEGRRFVDNIVTASERMNQLIEDLLTYSKLERRELSKSRIALASVIDRVMAEREIELHHLGADVTAEVGDLAVSADADALIQAVRNLVDNALKFSSAARPPRVAIKASAAGGKVALSVSDNGCGFDMKYHQRIFDIFQRLHRIEEYPGTGVGLAIVRKAIERMGGRVWAESEPGAGATFFMELPA
jgi:PAS domain S-box-containing protein